LEQSACTTVYIVNRKPKGSELQAACHWSREAGERRGERRREEGSNTNLMLGLDSANLPPPYPSSL
jgi:hypothetical protein